MSNTSLSLSLSAEGKHLSNVQMKRLRKLYKDLEEGVLDIPIGLGDRPEDILSKMLDPPKLGVEDFVFSSKSGLLDEGIN